MEDLEGGDIPCVRVSVSTYTNGLTAKNVMTPSPPCVFVLNTILLIRSYIANPSLSLSFQSQSPFPKAFFCSILENPLLKLRLGERNATENLNEWWSFFLSYGKSIKKKRCVFLMCFISPFSIQVHSPPPRWSIHRFINWWRDLITPPTRVKRDLKRLSHAISVMEVSFIDNEIGD